jgi:hypothetical protein
MSLRTILPDWVARKYDAEEAKRILDKPAPEPKVAPARITKAQKMIGKNIAFGPKMPNGMRVKGNMSASIKSKVR